MAIYLPPAFCGEEAELKLKKDLIWNDLFVACGEVCRVEDMIGYTYIISPLSSLGKVKHRMKNSIMNDYFEIINIGRKPWMEENKQSIQVDTPKREMVKDIPIPIGKSRKIIIGKGKVYYCLKDQAEDGRIFWDLIEEETFERTLRIKDSEYKEYFMDMNTSEIRNWVDEHSARD